jgi:hypothetical protein
MASLHYLTATLPRCRPHAASITLPPPRCHPGSGVDHAYWGRPDEQTGPRPATIYNAKSKCADLLGAVSAALASCSLVFKANDPAFANRLLDHAQQLYAWGSRAENAGKAMPGQTVVCRSRHASVAAAAPGMWRLVQGRGARQSSQHGQVGKSTRLADSAVQHCIGVLLA